MKPEVGKTYGYRKGIRANGQPLVPAYVVKLGPPKSKQVRVRWESGEYEGLEEWINPLHLLCTWEEHDTFLRDEILLLQVIDASIAPHNPVEDQAVNEVFAALDPSVYTEFSSRKNNILVARDFLDKAAALNIKPEEWIAEPFAFIDRFGTYYGTFATAMRLAKKLCQLSPETVLRLTKNELLRHSAESRTAQHFSSDSWFRNRQDDEILASKFRQDQEQVVEILHSWCGVDFVERQDRLEELENEVARLRKLLVKTLDWMQQTAEQYQLRWLRTKYAAIYKDLTGDHPPRHSVVPVRATNKTHYSGDYNSPAVSKNAPPLYWIRVSQSDSSVELWSTTRLPFEPKDWMRQMRDELRQVLRQIRKATGKSFLQATYISTDTGYFDTENTLLYNVGVSSFKHLCQDGIAFKHTIQTPPDCPVTLDGEAAHFYRYETTASMGISSAENATIAKWISVVCPPLTQSTKPHVIWSLLRQHDATTTTREWTGAFGLNLTLSIPSGTSINAAGLMKPLLDGIVSAFHAHDGSHLSDVANQLSRLTGLSSEYIETLLMESDRAVLGRTRLIYPRGTGIQWAPNDHLCMEATLNMEYVDQDEWTMSGRLYAISPDR